MRHKIEDITYFLTVTFALFVIILECVRIVIELAK